METNARFLPEPSRRLVACLLLQISDLMFSTAETTKTKLKEIRLSHMFSGFILVKNVFDLKTKNRQDVKIFKRKIRPEVVFRITALHVDKIKEEKNAERF